MAHVTTITAVLNGSVLQGLYVKSESNMNIENEKIRKNFAGEPWVVPLHAQNHPETTRRRSSQRSPGLQADLMPILQLIRMMGILPINFQPNGEVDFKLLSWITLYSVLIQGIIVVTTVITLKERLGKLADDSADFKENVLEISCSLCFFPAFLGLINHLPESGKKARFFKDWGNLEVTRIIIISYCISF
ncbi:uncharacterized protein LOC110830114 isoform X1 [Zootermopsis nevadensis]|uniref:uncharacterized protein LOC110830114 isoform X1 n=1 Tax=Zootermopsis nevadensis TaxID=136037 RepID=UPI000B8EA8FF|nr:uncharacterized protein LOC110830114 isoform X1 [Zootermopsis nevadensis]